MNVDIGVIGRKKEASSAAPGGPVAHQVIPGESIPVEAGFLRGHGTYLDDASSSQRLIASVSGFVERVNKLVTVRPLLSRYQGEVGDVVVGRVTEVAQGRWKVDINAKMDAVLPLSAVNLPGGVQRKRTYLDELNMRSFFVEGDLVSCEVQSFYADGSAGLHTRSTRYGKLLQGTFVSVPAALVKRCKSHFIRTEYGVSVVLGNNGYIWVYPSAVDDAMAAQQSQGQYAEPALVTVSPDLRSRMARVANSFTVLASHGVYVAPATVAAVYDESVRAGLSTSDMLRPTISATLAAAARSQSTL
eukprot:m51a1_g11029 putative exosome complex component rrp4-like (302) ;mRNA; r:422171-423311